MKMNIDGVYTNIDDSLACGGILCDRNDELICGFYCKMTSNSSLFSKM